jgi:cellulose synthase/poly-beta-1,6-N-acetylglucosamine synthase-like glycosyltransferase
MTMGVLREDAVVRGGFALVRELRFAMGKRSRLAVGRNLLLWGYAASVAGFYAVAYERTLRTGPAGSTEGDDAHVEEQSGRAGDESETHWPRVSVIVPARNEERNIRACVTSLLEQDYPNYQVIVVDDASTDATPRILDEIRQTHPRAGRLRVVRVERLPEGWAGKPHALHTGAAVADGEWLLFTDAECTADGGAAGARARSRFAVLWDDAGFAGFLGARADTDGVHGHLVAVSREGGQ